MAIPKKGSRKIVVENRTYRWLVRRKNSYWQTCFGYGKLNVAVDLFEKPGCSLFIRTDRKHPNDIYTTEVIPLRPSDISDWISQARNLGWHPESKGKPFRTVVSQNKLQLEKKS